MSNTVSLTSSREDLDSYSAVVIATSEASNARAAGGRKRAQVCNGCPRFDSCPRTARQRRLCYQREYNRTKRNRRAERLRQALYREQNFPEALISRVKHQASRRGLEFDLTVEWVRAELKGGHCAATGIKFERPEYSPGKRGQRGPWTPSLDRIDNHKGYVKENCRFVVWMYNLAKNNYADEDVACLAEALISRIRQGETN